MITEIFFCSGLSLLTWLSHGGMQISKCSKSLNKVEKITNKCYSSYPFHHFTVVWSFIANNGLDVNLSKRKFENCGEILKLPDILSNKIDSEKMI